MDDGHEQREGPGRHDPAEGGHGDAVEATGWAAEIERLAGSAWMALSAGDRALSGAAHYLDPVELARRRQQFAAQRSQTIEGLHALAHDHHIDSPLLHWLDAPAATRRLLGLPNEVTACVFDLDSVLTTSTDLHAAAWADTFDSYLLARAVRLREPYTAFDRRGDYRAFVSERPRLEGVREFLASRGIRLDEGEPTDGPDTETVHGLANRKEAALERHLAQEGVAAYVGSRCYLEAAHLAGVSRAVVSSSSTTGEILQRAGLTELVDQRIDAAAIEAESLAPKPAPDTLIAACRRLGVEPGQAADFETTPAGVAAARAAGFRAVVAVEREGPPEELRAADVVVNDLAQLLEHHP